MTDLTAHYTEELRQQLDVARNALWTLAAAGSDIAIKALGKLRTSRETLERQPCHCYVSAAKDRVLCARCEILSQFTRPLKT